MKKMLLTKLAAFSAMSTLLFSTSLQAQSVPGTLDTTMNPGGPKPGTLVKSMSPYTNIALGLGVLTESSSASTSSGPVDYDIVLNGDAVATPNPLEPLIQSCPFDPCAPVLDINSNCCAGQSPTACCNDVDSCCFPGQSCNSLTGCCSFVIPCCPTCDPSSDCELNCCSIDGFVDERAWSLVRLRQDGSVHKSFGPNGNGKVYFTAGQVPDLDGDPIGPGHLHSPVSLFTAQHGLAVDNHNRIDYFGNLQVTEYDALCGPNVGTIGQSTTFRAAKAKAKAVNADPNNPPDCNFTVDADPNHFGGDRPYGQTQIAVGRFLPNGELDSNFGQVANPGLFILNLVSNTALPNVTTLLGVYSLGDIANAGILDKSDKQNLLVVGGSSFNNAQGCIYFAPLIFRLKGGSQIGAGTLDSTFNAPYGLVVEGGQDDPDFSNFTDETTPSPVPLGYAQYQAVAVHNNGGPLQGYIVAVGDADHNGIQYPSTARIIAARYAPDGTLDTTFGNDGYLVISAQNQSLNTIQKQLLCRSVAIDALDNIYLGGDIADNNSGLPGAVTIPTSEPTNLVLRPTASFLLIKLNPAGQPQDFGPPTCDSVTCDTTVFASCRTCNVDWFNGDTTIAVRAVTTDLGFDEAIYDLLIDNLNGTILAGGQMSEDQDLQSIRAGFARYKLSTGGLDPHFGTFGLAVVDGGRNRRTLVRNMLFDPNGQILAAGQSGFSEEEVTEVNFSDATKKDFFLLRMNP